VYACAVRALRALLLYVVNVYIYLNTDVKTRMCIYIHIYEHTYIGAFLVFIPFWLYLLVCIVLQVCKCECRHEFVYTDIYNMTICGVLVRVYIRVCIHVCAYSRIACRADLFVYCEYTAWRRPIGCLNLQVFFRKRATNHRSLLWKKTYIYTYSSLCCSFCMLRVHSVAKPYTMLQIAGHFPQKSH